MGFLSLSPTRGEVWRGVKSGYIELTLVTVLVLSPTVLIRNQ